MINDVLNQKRDFQQKLLSFGKRGEIKFFFFFYEMNESNLSDIFFLFTRKNSIQNVMYLN